MSLRVKLDEDLSPVVAQPLLEAGYAVATVASQGWSGLPDADLWSRVNEAGEFFITADKGFGDTRVYLPGAHPGILLLRPDHESVMAFRSLLARVLERHTLQGLRGMMTVASPRGIRIRRPPASGASR